MPLSPHNEEIKRLTLRVEELEAYVKVLETDLGWNISLPPVLGLTKTEAAAFGILVQRKFATKEAMMTATYHANPDIDLPTIKIIDVMVCKIRKKLKPLGIEIKTLWGQGYYLEDEGKRIARRLIAENPVSKLFFDPQQKENRHVSSQK